MISLIFTKGGSDSYVLSERDLFDFNFEHSCFSGDTFELGGINAKLLNIIIDNNGGWYPRGAFAGSRVRLEINNVHVGTFNVELPKRRDGIIELTAYDDITKLDTEYPTDYEFPQTFHEVTRQCLHEAGLPEDYVDNIYEHVTGVISYKYTDYIYANSCRQLLSGMAEWNGGFGLINSDNVLEIKDFATEISRYFNSSDLFNFDYSDETVTFTKLKTSQKNKIYEKGNDDGYTLIINNQYIQYGLDDEVFEMMLTALYEQYSGFTLTPMSFVLTEPDLTLQLGDRICVHDDEEDIDIVGNISKIQISGNMTMTVTCGGFGNVSSVSGYNPTSVSQTEQAKKNAEENAQPTYTTKIDFKTGGFDLYFNTLSGEVKNKFTVTEDSSGKITKIRNETAAREIEVTYNDG